MTRAERLKIDPSKRFIRDVVRENGEAILVLGGRKAESQRRALTMAEAADAQRQFAQLVGLYARRRLVERRRVAVFDAVQKPLGAHQQVAVGHVSEGERRRRMPVGGRYLDAKLRHQPVRLLGLHGGR